MGYDVSWTSSSYLARPPVRSHAFHHDWHSDKLHVIERYRRIDLGHLETEVTVEDPGILKKPWTLKRVSDLAPGEEIREFMCAENNRDLEHLVGH